jgi:hypothetical protein
MRLTGIHHTCEGAGPEEAPAPWTRDLEFPSRGHLIWRVAARERGSELTSLVGARLADAVDRASRVK